MRLDHLLNTTTRLFLDTSPIIYFIEKHPIYFPRVHPILQAIDVGVVTAVTSPITLAECLVAPFHLHRPQLQLDLTDILTNGKNTVFEPIEAIHAINAALTLTDALQVAVAIATGCDSLLTNDRTLKRIDVINVYLIDELENG